MAKATKEPVQHELTLMDSFITQDRNEYSEGDKMSALFHEPSFSRIFREFNPGIKVTEVSKIAGERWREIK